MTQTHDTDGNMIAERPLGTPFNLLTPAEAERLAMLAEECGEVTQAIGKILRHGYDSRHPNGGPDNRETLEKEVYDLLAVLALMIGDIDTSKIVVSDRIREHMHRKLKYAHHQPSTTI